jgi:hypothetical protein
MGDQPESGTTSIYFDMRIGVLTIVKLSNK